MIEAWLLNVADQFWHAVGTPQSVPRDLARVVSYGLPVACTSLPDLRVRSVEAWFRARGTPYHFLCADRSLCGCIVATRGTALIFACSDDTMPQQRFTVAHEIAHFLLDHQGPRRDALSRLGQGIVAVLDGDRAATPTERIHAVLGQVQLDVYVDLMARDQMGQPYVLRAESRADRLALELLAPADMVEADLATFPARMPPLARMQSAGDLLRMKYGLPSRIADGYARWLLRSHAPPSTADWLGLR